MHGLKNYCLSFFALVLGAIFLMLSASCSKAPLGDPYWGAADVSEPRILISTILAGSESISIYDINGNFQGFIANYAPENLDPDGIAVLNSTNFAVALDGTDQIRIMNIFGETLRTITHSLFTGNLYKIESIGSEIFATESNVIESFTTDGERIGNPRIATTIGSCVLSTPVATATSASGYLIVAGIGNDDINFYDISDPANTTCVTSNQSLGNVNPYALLAHSNGSLYVATQGDDAIYQFAGDGSGTGTSIFAPGTTVLNNPTDMLELPDGSILIASDGTNNIIRISEDGTLLDNPFIQNPFTGQVGQMRLIGGDQ